MATRYVDSAATGAADGTSEADAWTTVDAAMDAISGLGAGPHLVYVKASASYAENPVIDTGGTSTAAVVFEGYTTTPGDGGQATITGSDTRANCVTSGIGGDANYVFKNFIFTNATGIAFNTAGDDIFSFYNCTFQNSDSAFQGDNEYQFIQCTFTGCDGSSGAMVEGDNGQTFIACSFNCASWTGNFIINGYNMTVAFCEFYGFGSAVQGVLNFDNQGGPIVVMNCTFDGENTSTSGIRFGNTNVQGPYAFINNIFYDLEYAVEGASMNPTDNAIAVNNLYNSLTAQTLTADIQNIGAVTTAPGFTNEAGDDYTLTSGANAEDAGIDASDAP